MTLKNTWAPGEQFFSSDANAVATQVNINTANVAAAESAAEAAQSTATAAGTAASGKYTKPGGGVPATDLSTAVQDELTAAGTAYQKPGGGIPKTDMATAVQTSLGKADTAYQAPAVVGAGATQAAARDAIQTLSLVQAAKTPDLLVTGAVTVDGNDLVTSAAVVWPDGSVGTLTITSRDSNSAVLGYNITYGSPVTKTFTQPTITRNTNGVATNVPAIVVT